MLRFIWAALAATAAGLSSALAQPMPVNPYGNYYAPPAPQVAAVPAYAEPPRADLGGGFIEFVFSGGRTRHGLAVAPPAAPQVAALPMQPQPLYPVYAPAPAAPPPVVQASLPPSAAPLDSRFQKHTVAYNGDEKPGTIIVNTPEHFLYLVEEGHKALRYGIGVGRPGFTWAGVHHITAKREWPDWIPPDDMLQRRPDLPHFMAGGPDNPLGARALYIGSTLYRIHGSNEPWTIGQNVSSGCIRLRNEDVIDLYDRVKVGAKVVVM